MPARSRLRDIAPISPAHDMSSKSDPPMTPISDSIVGLLILIFGDLSPKAQGVLVQMFTVWMEFPAKRRAVMLKTLMEELTDQQVADAVGVRRTTLYDWPEYRRLKRLLESPDVAISHGSKSNSDSDFDGWHDHLCEAG